VAIAGVWVAITYYFPHHQSGVEASCGSVAIGGGVTTTTINAGVAGNADCSKK
jgi:hypothetical protein